MDDYMFKANVDRCKHVQETTTYLEIFSYSVSLLQLEMSALLMLAIVPGSELEYGRRASVDA